MEVLRYQSSDGTEPFTEWLGSLRDKNAQAQIRLRLRRLEVGLLGDVEPAGDGVSELRIHVGAGYRVYFGQQGKRLIILLCGGDKKSQRADIDQAKGLWKDWKRRQP